MKITHVRSRILQARTRRLRCAVTALVLPLIFAPTLTMARDGLLGFRGSVVNYSCDVSASVRGDNTAAGQSLEVAPGVRIYINDARGPCGNQAAPFAIDYQLLPATVVADTETSMSYPSRAAQVTLTYH